MKTLSLLQPWATLVVMGVKTIETRSWQTAYRGPLLIHASLGKKGSVLCSRPLFQKHIRAFEDLPFGAIVGSVTLKEILPVVQLQLSAGKLAAMTLEENAFGDNTRRRYAWIVTDPVPFETPIPVKGVPGLWNYDPLS